MPLASDGHEVAEASGTIAICINDGHPEGWARYNAADRLGCCEISDGGAVVRCVRARQYWLLSLMGRFHSERRTISIAVFLDSPTFRPIRR